MVPGVLCVNPIDEQHHLSRACTAAVQSSPAAAVDTKHAVPPLSSRLKWVVVRQRVWEPFSANKCAVL